MGIDEADSLHGEVSWISPIARALLKARERRRGEAGDAGRARDVEVLEVRYPEPAAAARA